MKPPDFRHPELFQNGATESAIAQTLALGIAGPVPPGPHAEHTHHVLAMPKFDHLTEVERRSVALFVLSLSHTDE